MMAKLYSMLAIFSIATMLATGGLCTFLYGSGKINAGRLDTIAAVLRGEFDESEQETPEEAAVAEENQQEESGRAQSAEEVRAVRHQSHLRMQMLERARQDMTAQRRLLDQSLQYLIEKEEQVTQKHSDFTEQQKQLTEEVQDIGFERELEYVASLPPKQAKDHIIYTWNKRQADAVRLFMQLDVSKGKRILKEFKTPEEARITSQLLEQLRTQKLEDHASESGTTDGATTP